MALKKSELYSSLWASCDELRGGMDASQYKDYVLVLLFIKYISDKYADQPYAEITVPQGASFRDMVALKGKSDIGDQINKKIIDPLAKANKLSDFPDFNDAAKLGSGKEMVERLTNLIAIFENPALDFSKNRLRDQDIHKIVDVFDKGLEVPRYSRMVSVAEIEKNDFNLNLPRYIDSTQSEDMQDIEGPLKGGIQERDVDALAPYWSVCPTLKTTLFSPLPRAGEGPGERAGYLHLTVEKSAIKPTIYTHSEFTAFINGMNAHFAQWRDKCAATLKALQPGLHPKEVIAILSEDLLADYKGEPLIAADGWKATTYRVIETKKGKDGKPGKTMDKGWACDLVPKPLIVARYYAEEQAAIDQLAAELEEEQRGDEGTFSELGKINKAILSDMDDEIAALETKLTKARQLKQGMMQELLTGRIRLPLEPAA